MLWWRKQRPEPNPDPDYRDRWPTQMTLVESCDTRMSDKPGWRETIGGFFRSLFKSRPSRRAKPPGKSTHPYDTEFNRTQRTRISASAPVSALGSRQSSAVTSPTEPAKTRWWNIFGRSTRPSSGPATAKGGPVVLTPMMPVAPVVSKPTPRSTPAPESQGKKTPEPPRSSMDLRRWLNAHRLSPFPRGANLDGAAAEKTPRCADTTKPPPPPPSPPPPSQPQPQPQPQPAPTDVTGAWQERQNPRLRTKTLGWLYYSVLGRRAGVRTH